MNRNAGETLGGLAAKVLGRPVLAANELIWSQQNPKKNQNINGGTQKRASTLIMQIPSK